MFLPMDIGELTQLTFVMTTALIMARVGWAAARWIDRRGSGDRGAHPELAERLRVLEDEHLAVRQDLAELQERQDFTERALVRERAPSQPRAPEMLPERGVTPH